MLFVHGVMSYLSSFIFLWKNNPTSLNSLYLKTFKWSSATYQMPMCRNPPFSGSCLRCHSVQLILGRSLPFYLCVFNIFVLYIWSWNHYNTRVKDPEQRSRGAGLYHVHRCSWSDLDELVYTSLEPAEAVVEQTFTAVGSVMEEGGLIIQQSTTTTNIIK